MKEPPQIPGRFRPDSSVIVGNPPFVGNKKVRRELGPEYATALRAAYKGALPAEVDLVCYWFEKSRKQLVERGVGAVGLVATQAIRNGANRSVLDAISKATRVFEAWSDEPWWDRGTAVRVSMVCFGRTNQECRLDGSEVPVITADLRGNASFDLTTAGDLSENHGKAFQGPVKVGAFDIDGDLARKWLATPNPSGKSNADVLKPLMNGDDVTGRRADRWIIDFHGLTEADASLYFDPFEHVKKYVYPARMKQNDASRKFYWWRHGRSGAEFRQAVAGIDRYIATSRVSKHRFFVWLSSSIWPDSRLLAITLDDDFSFGVLSSRIHTVWSLAKASMHGVGNDPTYNAESCFETFPFPSASASDEAHRQVSAAAVKLNTLRESWLNPPEWCDRSEEVTPIGLESSPYPQRVLPKPGHEADLEGRTLTDLYNAFPTWLAEAHANLDRAVAAAYGWTEYSPEMSDDEILKRVLALNSTRMTQFSIQFDVDSGFKPRTRLGARRSPKGGVRDSQAALRRAA
ncbi:class I SAM-dependent DNA methyltransferase [Ramlibacter albus]|uniref:site-specific DNA-methyltransferase (adenine-specific) n=1 Tax=Ramlibacter albus TaxID=2079448 RepID=A0A923M8Q8_9BURK|nr:class I SAM-dependent DNA methyltransferase [Ramlibacter albus]MBC5764582.1 class I SAM-dependent DNA methyltransferase [Ramlibacter albus]